MHARNLKFTSRHIETAKQLLAFVVRKVFLSHDRLVNLVTRAFKLLPSLSRYWIWAWKRLSPSFLIVIESELSH